MPNVWINKIIDVGMHLNCLNVRSPLLKATRNPRKVQEALLLSILQQNSNTEFGREYNFSDIENIEQYRARVPVSDYDAMSPYIERQVDGANALTQASPEFYARTSGTTGRFKDIPLTHSGIAQVGLAQKQLAISLWQSTDFFKGRVLGFAGSADEGTMRNGLSYGSVSGVTYRSLSRIVARKFAVPAAALSLKDHHAKYQVFALTVLGSIEISGIVTANPSTVLHLVRLLNSHANDYLNILLGTDSEILDTNVLPLLPEIKQRASLERVKQLRKIFDQQGFLSPEDVFPYLSAIATWTGGSCGTAIRQLKPYLPDSVQLVEYGYGASEFMGSVNINATTNQCIPMLNQHVYEFVQRDLWEDNKSDFIGIEELEPGQDYYVFVTTQSGLYRYNINDIIRAGDHTEKTPGVRFLQKGKGVTNITGEKLSEYQFIEALDKTLSKLSIDIGGYLGLANEDQSRYDVYLEGLASSSFDTICVELDRILKELNAEYEDKRNSGRLKPPIVYSLVDGACNTIKQWNLDRGVREVQYKPTVLDYSKNWQGKLEALMDTPNAV